MYRILTIAKLTWMEARRRRIVLAALIGGAAFLAVFGTAVFFINRSVTQAEGLNAVLLRTQFMALTQAGLYVVNFLTLAVAILLAVDTLSGEIDSGVMQTLASKPIRRSEILLGKWLTYWLMTAGYLLLTAGGLVLIMRWLTGFAQQNMVIALPFMLLGATVMLNVSLAGGARLKTITNGMLAFAYYGVAFLSGWIEQVGAALGNDTARRIGTAVSLVSPSDAMWRRAAYEMQPVLARNLAGGNPFSSFSVPSVAMIYWTLAVAVASLLLAFYLFRRRPL
jgi:ABC-type transport system involved in multi-copper enzyme maturation permease subunit